MLISTEQLDLGEVEFRQSFPAGTVRFDEHALRQVSALVIAGRAALIPGSGGEIRIAGNLTVELEAECDRCLDSFRITIQAPFALTYAPVAQAAVVEEVEIDEASAEVGFYEGAGILVEDVAREQILLSLPYRLLCHDRCLGLCPHCGRNRNRESCQCGDRRVDSRWDALRNLRL